MRADESLMNRNSQILDHSCVYPLSYLFDWKTTYSVDTAKEDLSKGTYFESVGLFPGKATHFSYSDPLLLMFGFVSNVSTAPFAAFIL